MRDDRGAARPARRPRRRRRGGDDRHRAHGAGGARGRAAHGRGRGARHGRGGRAGQPARAGRAQRRRHRRRRRRRPGQGAARQRSSGPASPSTTPRRAGATPCARALDGREVTVALDGVGGALGRGALELLGVGGRLILFGLSSGAPTELSTGDLYSRGLTVSAAIGARIAQRPGGVRDLEEQALAAAADGRARPARAALRPRRRPPPRTRRSRRAPPSARPCSCPERLRRAAAGREYGQHQYGSPSAPPA